MSEENVLIPKERVAVLIGKGGATRRKIERLSKTKISINSESGEVKISAKDAINCWNCKHVVEPIARGFNPNSACKLFTDKYIIEFINLRDFGARERKDRYRLRARVIGTNGRTRHLIQEYTNTEVIIYGKTIGILGKPADVERARRAIEMILSGSKQGTALAGLRAKRTRDTKT